MAGKKNRALYQLKVMLQEIQPCIWRRVQVWEDATLTQLHHILQIVMGWEDWPGRPGDLHPESPTDPDVNLSIHPARATQ